MSTSPAYFNAIRNPVAQIINGDGTAYVSMVVGGASGTKLESAVMTNSDAAVATVVQLCVTAGAVDYIIGEVTIPAGAGTNGTVKGVDLLNITDLPFLRSDGMNRYLYLASGSTLKIKAKVAVAGVNKLQFFGQAGDA